MGKFDTYYIEAKRKYVEENNNLKQIKDDLNISMTTLSKWKNAEAKSWDEQRKDFLIQGAGAVTKLKEVILSKINDISELSDPKAVKELYQLKNLLEKFEVQNDIHRHIVNAMPEFAKFVNEKHPELKEQISSLIVEFYKWIDKK